MKSGVAALVLCLASCAVLPSQAVIMPGYLDLPVAPGHKLVAERTTPRRVVVSFYGNVEHAENLYRDALRSMGWVDAGDHKLMKGEGPEARCILVYGWIMTRPSYRHPRRDEVSFAEESCSSPFD